MLIGVLLLAGFVAVLTMLPLFHGLDSAVAQFFLQMRTCGLQRFLDQTHHLSYAIAALFFLFTAASLRRRTTFRHLWGVATTIGTGAILVQLLKTLVVRERPSMIPGMAIGHSMPSGDITNGALAIGAAVWLARKTGSRPGPWFYPTALFLMVLVAFLRLAPLRHWFSDALASSFLALSWLSICLSIFPRSRWWTPLGWAAVLGSTLLMVTYVPWMRLNLASPLRLGGRPVAVWHAASAQQVDGLIGDWSQLGLGGRLPSVALHDGEGALFVELPRPADYLLQLGMLPAASETDASSCATLEITVNHQPVGSFVPSGGWRQYQLDIPKRVTRAGQNRIGLRLLSQSGDRALKLSYLLIYPR